MEHKIKWLTNAAYEFTYNGTVVTTDPSVRFMAYKGLDASSYTKPDYIIISHLHWDHMSEIKDLYNMYKPTIISGALGRQALVKYVDGNGADFYPVYPETVLDFGDVKFRALYAIHKDVQKPFSEQVASCKKTAAKIDDQAEKLQEIGSLEMVNYVVTWPDGFTILVWGGELNKMQENYLRDLKPDVAIMQFASIRLDEYTAMIDAVKPKKVLSYHHDSAHTKEVWYPRLKAVQDKYSNFIIMDNLEEISL